MKRKGSKRRNNERRPPGRVIGDRDFVKVKSSQKSQSFHPTEFQG